MMLVQLFLFPSGRDLFLDIYSIGIPGQKMTPFMPLARSTPYRKKRSQTHLIVDPPQEEKKAASINFLQDVVTTYPNEDIKSLVKMRKRALQELSKRRKRLMKIGCLLLLISPRQKNKQGWAQTRRKEQLKLSVTRGLPYSTRIDRVRK